MRRNLAPRPDIKKSSFSNKQSVANHLQKIGSMVNAPSRRTQVRRVVVQSPNISDGSDDEYLDDYLLDDSSSQQSDEQSDFVRQILRKSNKERGATATEISQLASIEVKEENGKSDDVCSICLQEWVKGEKYSILPCAHKFHGGCISDWLGQKNKCPCCMSAVF